MTQFSPLKDLCEVRRILSRISFLGGVSDAHLDVLLGYFQLGLYPAGATIAKEGEVASHIYIIQSGLVNLMISDGDRVVNKRAFTVGDSFGEAALLSLVNNTASFVAAEDCELIVFSRQSLGHLRKEEPELFTRLILNLARDLARKLQYTDEILLRMDASH